MFNFSAILTPAGLANLGQIIVGDLTMAGDNVVIMGSLASGLPEKDRRKVLLFGVSMALVFLITFALLATQLLKITGLVFAGGLLLLWVAYNIFRELHPSKIVIHGFRRQLRRLADPALPLEQLHRPCRHPLRRKQDDLRGLGWRRTCPWPAPIAWLLSLGTARLRDATRRMIAR